jgi:hypothetical protein
LYGATGQAWGRTYTQLNILLATRERGSRSRNRQPMSYCTTTARLAPRQYAWSLLAPWHMMELNICQEAEEAHLVALQAAAAVSRDHSAHELQTETSRRIRWPWGTWIEARYIGSQTSIYPTVANVLPYTGDRTSKFHTNNAHRINRCSVNRFSLRSAHVCWHPKPSQGR